eukprot:s886_g3.t1
MLVAGPRQGTKVVSYVFENMPPEDGQKKLQKNKDEKNINEERFQPVVVGNVFGMGLKEKDGSKAHKMTTGSKKGAFHPAKDAFKVAQVLKHFGCLPRVRVPRFLVLPWFWFLVFGSRFVSVSSSSCTRPLAAIKPSLNDYSEQIESNATFTSCRLPAAWEGRCAVANNGFANESDLQIWVGEFWHPSPAPQFWKVFGSGAAGSDVTETKWFAQENFFKGGAGASRATGRRRQEKVSILLQGLRDLLANLDTAESDSENDQGDFSANSPRGRPAFSPPTSETSRRDEPPGWQEVPSKKTRNTNGKGKGTTADRLKSRLKAGPGPLESRKVTFARDENPLLAQLKALVLEFETGSKGNLLSKLRQLVDRFGQEKPPPKVAAPKGGKPVPPDKGGRTVSFAPLRPQVVAMLPKLDATWWKTGQMTSRQLSDALDQGTKPTGNLACVTAKDAVQMRALAERHYIQVNLALVLADLPTTGDSDHSVTNTSVQWVRLVGGRWKSFLVVPLCSNLPTWPEQPDVKKVDKVPQNDSLSSFRVFSREFLTPMDWNNTVKKPTDTLGKCLPEGVSARAYGWHVNNSSKEEAVVGFFKASATDVASIIQRSGWKNGFFQRLAQEDQKEREPIKWLVRGDRPASAYLAEARTLAKTEKMGLVLRRGGP